MIHILIADDHAIVRKGLKEILTEEYPSAHIVEVGDAESLVKNALKGGWDIIISDMSMPGRSGLDALSQIKHEFPRVPVLILSMHPEEMYAVRVLKAGASGYLNKETAPDELIKAVQRLLQGRKYISHAIAEKLADGLDQGNSQATHELLSDREFDVMKMLAQGKTVTDIAEHLSLSITTVSTYRTRIMTKMNMKSNAELARYAIENKLL